MIIRLYTLLFLFLMIVPVYAGGELLLLKGVHGSAVADSYSSEIAVPSMVTDKPSQGKLIARYAVLVSVPLTTYLFAWLSWDWGDVRSHWKWADEGWFERSTYAGGADKMGHIFSHYLMTRLLYMVFNYTENGGYKKWIFSSVVPVMLALGIELGDAFSSAQNGFAYQDMLCGFMGISLGIVMEWFPLVDSFLGFSIEYFPSEYFRRNMNEILRFVDDYSGWKFMLNFKLAGFRDLGFNIPYFLRYIMVDVGYYTRGFTDHDERVGNTGRKRNVFIGISVNMMEIVDDIFRKKYPRTAFYLKQPFKYIHLPVGYKYNFEID